MWEGEEAADPRGERLLLLLRSFEGEAAGAAEAAEAAAAADDEEDADVLDDDLLLSLRSPRSPLSPRSPRSERSLRSREAGAEDEPGSETGGGGEGVRREYFESGMARDFGREAMCFGAWRMLWTRSGVKTAW